MALYVITGPPAAGKTTYVQRHAKPGDIRIDLDHIANVLAGHETDNHTHTERVLTLARAARQAAITQALKLEDGDVYIIHSNPNPAHRNRYKRQGAIFVDLDPGEDVVMSRLGDRPKTVRDAAARWYVVKHAQQSMLGVSRTLDLPVDTSGNTKGR